MAITYYNAYKTRYGTINVRSSNSVTSSDIGDLPEGNYYLYYTDIALS